jgi:hypothetical protein
VASLLAVRHCRAQWGTLFHDASCLGALIDRFAQHCHDIDIDADSWRHKEPNSAPGARRSLRPTRLDRRT